MVKKPREGTGKGQNSVADAEVVVGGSETKKAGFKPSTSSKKLIVLVAVVVLVAVGTFYFVRRNNTDGVEVKQIPMGQAYINQQLADMKDNEPSKKAPLSQRLNYYDTLMTTEASTLDYKGATATYEKRIAISTGGMTALNYYRAAQWYAELKDKPGALKALDASEKALASASSESYSPEQFQVSIDALRQEVSK